MFAISEDEVETEAEGLYELGWFGKKFIEGRSEFAPMFEDIDEEEIRMAIFWRYEISLGTVFNAIVEDWSIQQIKDCIQENMK